MQSLRAFIASELSPNTKQLLKSISVEFHEKSDRRFRWIPFENIHLTLKFIGNIEFTKLEQLIKMLAAAVSRTPVIEYNLGGFGVFPNLDHPRIFWLGIKAPIALKELVDSIEKNAASIGIQHEIRPFTPHLTLCRFQQEMDKTSIRIFLNSLSPTLLNFSCQDCLTDLTIYKSSLTPNGSVYTPIAKIGMQKNPPSV